MKKNITNISQFIALIFVMFMIATVGILPPGIITLIASIVVYPLMVPAYSSAKRMTKQMVKLFDL